MTQNLTFKKKFKTQKSIPDKRKIISLHISEPLNEVITKAAHRTGITKQDLIRQMIRHCLKDLGYDIPQDTESPPPTKRIYQKK